MILYDFYEILVSILDTSFFSLYLLPFFCITIVISLIGLIYYIIKIGG